MKKAFENRINYFDTARAYSDSEEKMGAALADVRDQVIISTKTAAQDAKEFWKDLEKVLQKLQTDYIDLYQFHNPAFCPKPGDGTGLYEAALEAKEQGKSVISVLQIPPRIAVAKKRFYPVFAETLQFPFSYLASEEEKELVKLCKETNTGFIAMKGLAGDLFIIQPWHMRLCVSLNIPMWSRSGAYKESGNWMNSYLIRISPQSLQRN